MRTIRLTASVLAIAALGLVASCSDATSDTPDPSGKPPASSAAAGGLPHSGAPKVNDPIDTKPFEADPCSVITQRELSKAGVPIEEVEPDKQHPAGPSCSWSGPIEWGQFDSAFLTANTEGLSAQYEANEAGKWVYFESLTVEGYPAVFNGDLDHRKSGKCTINVGVRDDLTFYLLLQADREGPYYKNPCAGAKKLAAMAIQTMKAG